MVSLTRCRLQVDIKLQVFFDRFVVYPEGEPEAPGRLEFRIRKELVVNVWLVEAGVELFRSVDTDEPDIETQLLQLRFHFSQLGKMQIAVGAPSAAKKCQHQRLLHLFGVEPDRPAFHAENGESGRLHSGQQWLHVAGIRMDIGSAACRLGTVGKHQTIKC